ncbi:hypothetical protein QVM88_13420 [Providencia stuartii]|nr:hypothetical protein [Providencia stuartii]
MQQDPQLGPNLPLSEADFIGSFHGVTLFCRDPLLQVNDSIKLGAMCRIAR